MRAGGKFFYAGEEKLYVRGVTYGTFRDHEGEPLPPPQLVARDFAAMAAAGVNTVRTYTVAPLWLLDLAAEHGLRVLVGLPWEQHVAFLDRRATRLRIEAAVRRGVAACRRHPAVLGYAIGNEIPPSIVRWHGRQRVERFLERLYRAAKTEDPEALVTYANYPSTEYLHLPFLDFVAFNVFLEEREPLERYLPRLQTIAGDRPLVISELGLDSLHHGRDGQAAGVGTQIEAAFRGGAAGCCVFAWTDEWHRGGHEVADWDFGLVDRAREPKPALAAVSAAFAEAPFSDGQEWPPVSVVVCSYNGEQTIGECLGALAALDYPSYEVIVVDDGSTDATGQVADRFDGVTVLRSENRGLSAARNAGWAAASGEVIAFCDDDCRPDTHWLRYLVDSLRESDHAGVGGPNVPPRDAVMADSVGHAPGGPTHVLVSDSDAEHIPGCNMAFRRGVLEALGGFDPQFRVAGDDVDFCWRVQSAGGTLGFSPAALVWHRARGSARSYLRQQCGYGRAEALLERKWPERYNGSGHVEWGGLTYGGKARRSFGRRRWHVYYGATGAGLFQSVYGGATGSLSAFPMAPEWYLLVLALAAAAITSLFGPPLPFRIPGVGLSPALVLLITCLAIVALQAGAWTAAVLLPESMPRGRRLRVRALVLWLCLLQPIARLWGRSQHGLTPWRRRGPHAVGLPRRRQAWLWSEHWASAEEWLSRLEAELRPAVGQLTRGGDFDTWDLQVRIGPLAAARVRLAIEEHGHGRQLVRFRVWPRISGGALIVAAVLASVAASALLEGALIAGTVFSLAALWLAGRVLLQAAASVVFPARAAERLGPLALTTPTPRHRAIVRPLLARGPVPGVKSQIESRQGPA